MSAQIEATLDALVSKLSANLNAKIDAINTENADEYGLDYPASITAGIRNQTDFPRIFVLPEGTVTESDAASDVVWRHRVRVVAFVAEWDEGALMRKLIRYQRAVREVCLSKRSPGTGGGFGIIHISDEYGPVFQPDPEGGPSSEFVQGAASLFDVRQNEVVP